MGRLLTRIRPSVHQMGSVSAIIAEEGASVRWKELT